MDQGAEIRWYVTGPGAKLACGTHCSSNVRSDVLVLVSPPWRPANVKLRSAAIKRPPFKLNKTLQPLNTDTLGLTLVNSFCELTFSLVRRNSVENSPPASAAVWVQDVHADCACANYKRATDWSLDRMRDSTTFPSSPVNTLRVCLHTDSKAPVIKSNIQFQIFTAESHTSTYNSNILSTSD